MAARTFWRSDRSFSKNVATRLSTSSSTPPTSPARTMFTIRVLNVSWSLPITRASVSASMAPATTRPDASRALYLKVAIPNPHLPAVLRLPGLPILSESSRSTRSTKVYHVSRSIRGLKLGRPGRHLKPGRPFLLASPLDYLPQFVGEDGAGQGILQRHQAPGV